MKDGGSMSMEWWGIVMGRPHGKGESVSAERRRTRR